MNNVISFQSLKPNQIYKVLGYYSFGDDDDNDFTNRIFLIAMWNDDAHNAILYELLAPMNLIIYDFNHNVKTMKKYNKHNTYNFIVRQNAWGGLYPEFLDMEIKYILYDNDGDCDGITSVLIDKLNNYNKKTLICEYLQKFAEKI